MGRSSPKTVSAETVKAAMLAAVDVRIECGAAELDQNGEVAHLQVFPFMMDDVVRIYDDYDDHNAPVFELQDGRLFDAFGDRIYRTEPRDGGGFSPALAVALLAVKEQK